MNIKKKFDPPPKKGILVLTRRDYITSHLTTTSHNPILLYHTEHHTIPPVPERTAL